MLIGAKKLRIMDYPDYLPIVPLAKIAAALFVKVSRRHTAEFISCTG